MFQSIIWIPAVANIKVVDKSKMEVNLTMESVENEQQKLKQWQ